MCAQSALSKNHHGLSLSEHKWCHGAVWSDDVLFIHFVNDRESGEFTSLLIIIFSWKVNHAKSAKQ
jgi:hypothetical protein